MIYVSTLFGGVTLAAIAIRDFEQSASALMLRATKVTPTRVPRVVDPEQSIRLIPSFVPLETWTKDAKIAGPVHGSGRALPRALTSQLDDSKTEVADGSDSACCVEEQPLHDGELESQPSTTGMHLQYGAAASSPSEEHRGH